MNKSTPINQLPVQQGSQPSFVSDQQRNMITQAQQAIGNSTMPQNTQLQSEILNEDDSVIQDMLNNLNSSQPDAQLPSYIQQHQQQQQQQQQMQQNQLQQQQQDELMRLAAMNNLNINQLMSGYGPNPSGSYTTPSIVMPQVNNYTKQFTGLFTNEIKLIGIVFLVVIVVQFIPIHQYVGRYISIEKIPYHDIILKASLTASLVVILKKLLTT